MSKSDFADLLSAPKRTHRARMRFMIEQMRGDATAINKAAEVREEWPLGTLTVDQTIDYAMWLAGVPVLPWWHWRRYV